MAANYRYWCGECNHRTPWLTESEGADRHEEHYAQSHPEVFERGHVETRVDRGGGGLGCLGVLGALFLILVLASTCARESTSAPAPCTSCQPSEAPGTASTPCRSCEAHERGAALAVLLTV